MYEGEYIHMMFEAVRNRDWVIACNHAMDLLILLGEDESTFPQPDLNGKNMGQVMDSYANLYIKLSRLIARKVKTNIDQVRAMYRDKQFEIPKVKTTPKQGVAN